MDDTCTTGSRPTVDDERFEVHCIFDIFTDGRKRIWKSLDLPVEMLMTNDPIKERTCLLGDVLPLQLVLLLLFINLQCIPGTFLLIFLLLIMCIDVLIDGRQLLLRGRGNPVLKYGLLKYNEQ